MKQLTCEMCGSTDLMKDGGVFVCQTCGCKYSVEEARRMMVEGTVDVRGTVQVDNSAFVQKYLENARRAKEKEDWEKTEKYYNMVEQNDPNNIEAIFYSAYGKAKATLVDGDVYKRQAAFKVLQNCISIIDDKFDVSREEENKTAIISMSADLCKMILSNFVFTEWKNGYGVVTKTNKQDTYNMFGGLIAQFKESIDNIAKIADKAYLHEALILLFKTAVATGNYNSTTLNSWVTQEQSKIDELKKKEIDKYWNEHKEEKDALEAEKSALNSKIDELNGAIEALPEVNSVKQIEKQVESLKKEKDSLGLFKGKEKKALQEQIDNMNNKLSAATVAKSNAVAPIQKEIDELKRRIKEIDDELTKDR